MRILVVTNLYPPDVIGGYEMKCIEAVEALEARGHDVLVVTSIPRWPVDVPAGVERVLTLADVYDVSGRHSDSSVTRRLNHARANFVSADNVYRLTRAVEAFKPDVAYLWNMVGIGGLGLVAGIQYLGVPWVWQLFDTVPLVLCEFEGAVVPGLAREFEQRIEGRFLACSQRLVDEIDEGGIHLDGGVELVPMWIAGEKPPVRQSYFKGGHLRLIFAGRVTDYKGIPIIIEAAAQLIREGHANFSVDIFGHVSAADMFLKGLVHEHALQGIVTFKGLRPASDLAAMYGEYDLFAFPTWSHEPFAFAPLEAAGYGCVPLLSADCGNSEWFVHDVDCLKSIRAREPFAQQIRRVLTGEVDLAGIGARAQETVWDDFSARRAIDTVEHNLAEAAQRPRTAAGTGDDAYHLAMLAERVVGAMIKEAS